MPDTVVFLPCCMKKCDNGKRHDDDSFNFTANDLPNTLVSLNNGREKLENCIVKDSTPTSGLHLYRGRIYGPLQKEKNNMLTAIDKGQFRLFIISAGYGIVDAREKIKGYDATMIKDTSKLWKNIGLKEIIKELLLTVEPKRIFGYFTGKPEWNPNQAAAYRYFFTQGLESACDDGLKCDIAGCFYGKGMAGLTALGHCMLEHYGNNFSEEFAEDVAKHGWTYKKTDINFIRYCIEYP